ncbi:MAG TPA: hypothetical protein PKE69_02980 [Pyrinomonadaceae bacterium]|nr:hypothetical protein [Pyrinomonadaceae bacterium]
MQINKMLLSLLLLLGGFFTAMTIGKVAVFSVSENQKLSAKINSLKPSYILGEEVELNFKLYRTEDAEQNTQINQCGYLRIQIAKENESYSDYFGSKWQTETCEVEIPQKVDNFSEMNERVLWNVKPEVSHLNSDAAKRVSKGRIMTDYAFPSVGTYSIKAVLTLADENKTKIESEPIQIRIIEPIGNDLKIWNSIKQNGEIAYFIQQGRFLTIKETETEKLAQQIEQIVADYPDGILAVQLNQSLGKFRFNEIKRKEFLENLKQTSKN